MRVAPEENDTVRLLQALRTADDLRTVLAEVEGPWAVIYWQARTHTLWFGRDIYGRRSLLFRMHRDQFVLSSVAIRTGCAESDSALPTLDRGADTQSNSEDLEDGEAAQTYGWKEVPACGLFAFSFQVRSALLFFVFLTLFLARRV